MEEVFIFFSAACPEQRPFAQTLGVGAVAIDFCCPTPTLVQPIAGQTPKNVCTICVATAENNCDNFGKFQKK